MSAQSDRHHPTYTLAANRRFQICLRERGHYYDGVAVALQAAGLPRPSEGSPDYRDAILRALTGSQGTFPAGWLDALTGPPPLPEGYLDALVDGRVNDYRRSPGCRVGGCTMSAQIPSSCWHGDGGGACKPLPKCPQCNGTGEVPYESDDFPPGTNACCCTCRKCRQKHDPDFQKETP